MTAVVTPQLCIGGRELTEPKLDPSGRRLAYISRGDGAASIVLVDLDVPGTSAGVERQLTTSPPPSAGRGMGGGCYAWTPDGAAVVYAATDGGLWLQPVPGGAASQAVVGDTDRPAQAPAVSPDGQFVAYAVEQAEVWIAPLAGTDAPRRLDGGEHDFCLDPAVDPSSCAVAYQAWAVPEMAWDGAVVVTVDLTTGDRTVTTTVAAALQQPRFASDGTLFVVHDASGWLNVWRGDQPLIADGEAVEHAGPTWGPGQASYAISPDGRRAAFTRNERGFGRLCVADVDTGTVEEIGRGIHGQLSWRGERVAAVRSGARTPTQIVVYDASAGRSWARAVVAVGPPAGWDDIELVEPELLALDHDGTALHARWYRAPRPADKLLCWVHGGPTDQWTVSFMPRVAYWLGQGWDVLVVDHRGTTGHGRPYQQALHGRWGELDVEDTAALLAEAQRCSGIAPAATVAIGGSAGGMTVLGLLARHPDLVAGGVASYPVTDLVQLGPNSHRFEAHYTDTLVEPLESQALLRERSPLASAHRVACPLLILHGTDDPVVPASSTVEYAAAVRAAGGDVELHLFDGEGHGFRQPANQLREYELIGEFLARVTRVVDR